MSRSEGKTVFVCQECGRESPRWLGRCPDCQGWNTFLEVAVRAERLSARSSAPSPPQELSQLKTTAVERRTIPITELNRVLGGGIVPGAVALIAGEPGIGKSTLLLQAAAALAGRESPVVYASGEETAHQIKMRAARLNLKGEGLYVLATTDIENILEQAQAIRAGLLVVDSIQTVSAPGMEAASGSIGQVRECTLRLTQFAKSQEVPVFISGHITKEGIIAGPKALEHIVDIVLYLEGEAFSTYRLLRCVKNRFGSTHEVGVFEMKGDGLIEIANPSLAFIPRRDSAMVGTAIVPAIEGSRPILVEIQALTTPNPYGQVRRTANGVDFSRLLMVTAVLTKRVGLKLASQDILVNVTGGLKVDEPAADLAMALAIASSYRDSALAPDTVAIGEVGLSGELRAVSQLERRLAEAARLGFRRAIIPRTNAKLKPPEGMEIITVGTLREAVRALEPQAREAE